MRRAMGSVFWWALSTFYTFIKKEITNNKEQKGSKKQYKHTTVYTSSYDRHLAEAYATGNVKGMTGVY